jgi:hypothetical protein
METKGKMTMIKVSLIIIVLGTIIYHIFASI